MLVLWICLQFSYAFGIISGQSLQLTQSPFRNLQYYTMTKANNQINDSKSALLGNIGIQGANTDTTISSSIIRRNLNNYNTRNISVGGDQLTASAIQKADKHPAPNNYRTFNLPSKLIDLQNYNYKNNQPATRMKFFSEPTAYKPGAISNILSNTNTNSNSNNYRFTTTTIATTTKLPIIQQKPDFYNRQLLPTATETAGHISKLKFTPKISLPSYHDFHLSQLDLNTTHTQSLSSDTKHLPTYVPVFSYTSEIYHVNTSDDQYQTNTSPPYQQQLNSRKQRSLPYEYYPINNNIAHWNSAIYHNDDYNNYNYNYNNYNGNNYYNNNHNHNHNNNNNYLNDNYNHNNNDNNNYENANEHKNENDDDDDDDDDDISDEDNKADINQGILSSEEDMDYNNAINLPKSLDDNRLDIDLMPAKKIRYFHDFFIKYLGPHHVSFGHVERHPRLFETRFQTIRDSNRYKGEVIWSDNKGGYAEHYWDLAIGKI